MPNTTTELIRVTGVSPYSVYAGKARYSFNKDVNSTQFQKGHTYSVSVKVGKNGGKYIDRVDADMGVLNLEGGTSAGVTQPSENQRPLNPETNVLPPTGGVNTAPRRAKQGEPLTAYDLAIQEQISRSGVIQAAVQAVSPHVNNLTDLKEQSRLLAEDMLSWVTQKPVSHLQQPVSETQPIS